MPSYRIPILLGITIKCPYVQYTPMANALLNKQPYNTKKRPPNVGKLRKSVKTAFLPREKIKIDEKPRFSLERKSKLTKNHVSP